MTRGEHAFVLLNKFPYASGHLMVAPLRHVGELAELEPDEVAEVHALTTRGDRCLAPRLPAGCLQRRLEPR